MIATTKLLTTVPVVNAVVCRNIHVRKIHQEFKIIRMIDTPLRLLVRNLRKSSFVPGTLFATCVNLIDSMINCAVHEETKGKVMTEALVETCNIPNNLSEVYKLSDYGAERIFSVDDNSMRSITNLIHPNLIMGPGVNRQQDAPMTKQKYKSIRKWKPVAAVAPPVNVDTHFIVRILSYNILAQILLDTHFYLYRDHDGKALYWENRKILLQQEILKAKANVICLQEMQVDHLEEFVEAFQAVGFHYLYKKRTNDKKDGLLLLYRADQLKLVDHAKVELYQSGVDILNRDNVAIVAKFSLIESPETHIVISTTHLLYNPKRDDVRLAQTQLLFSELERIAFIEFTKDGSRYHPIILTGDFNLQPYTGVYRFITEGTFEYSGKSRSLEEGVPRGLDKSLIPPCLLVTDNCQHMNLLTKRLRGEGEGTTMIENMDEEKNRASLREKCKETSTTNKDEVDINTVQYQNVKIVEGQYAKFSSGTLTHPFDFYSLYQHSNKYGEAEATTNQGKWITVDYIFFDGVEPIDRYNLPTVSECKKLPTIPNALAGSDHLCLGATFKLRKMTKR